MALSARYLSGALTETLISFYSLYLNGVLLFTVYFLLFKAFFSLFCPVLRRFHGHPPLPGVGAHISGDVNRDELSTRASRRIYGLLVYFEFDKLTVTVFTELYYVFIKLSFTVLFCVSFLFMVNQFF